MKRLRKYISMLIRTWNMDQFDEASLDLITDGMTVDLYVLSPLVKDRVGCYMNGRFVVTKQLNSVLYLDLQVSKELLKPDEFTSDLSHSSVFGFSTASTNYLLLLTLTANKRFTNVYAETRDRATSIRASCPVSINKCI